MSAPQAATGLPGALDGIKVLELASEHAAWAGKLLAEARAAAVDRPVGLRHVHRDAVDPNVTHLGVVRHWPEPELAGARVVLDAVLG